MKKGLLRKFLAGILCVSILMVNDGTVLVYAVTEENTQEESKIQESEDVDETENQIEAVNDNSQESEDGAAFVKDEDGIGESVEVQDVENETKSDFAETQENTDDDTTIVISGNCGINGDNVKYVLDNDGLLTISGNGEMYSWESFYLQPWKDHRSSIKTIMIESGVTSIGDNAFYKCICLTGVSVPSSVTSIGNKVFSYCVSLTSVSLPSSVTNIGDSAFFYCSSLTGVSVPSSVTSIGDRVFYGCSDLTSVSLPSSVTSIGDQVFYGCKGLTSVSLPSSITSIGNDAFYGCSSLTSVNLPSSVISIGDSAFLRCSSLTSVSVPSSVTSIGNGVFYDCSSLTSVSLPLSITSIDDYAFYGCSSLTSMSVPSSVTSIGDRVFSGCSGLISVSVPSSVTSIGDDAFLDCNGLKSAGPIGGGYNYEFGWKEDIPDYAFSGCNGLTNVTIPSSVISIGDHTFSGCDGLKSAGPIGGGYNYEFGWKEDIPDYAFSGCSGLTSVSVPSSVTSIGEGALSGCSGLTSVSVPSSVTSIGEGAFSGCNGLKSAGPIGGGYNYEFGWEENIPDYAFSGCSGLISVSFPSSITSIGENAFSGCSGLTSVSFPSSITSIGESAFSGCSGLTSVSVPSSVTSIGSYAFYDCVGLKSVSILSSAISIGDDAFLSCNGLKSAGPIGGGYNYEFGWEEDIPSNAFSGCRCLASVSLPSSVTRIGDDAFSGCSDLTSVSLPSSVTSIGDRAFLACRGLTSVSVPSSVTSIGDRAFSGCSGLKNVSLPPSVIRIGDYAFSDCSGLKNVSVPSSVTSIGTYAFYGCIGLTSVSIPSSVTSIGNKAFSGCNGLKSAGPIEGGYNYEFGWEENIPSNAFSGCRYLASVNLPSSVTSIGDYAFSGCSGLKNVSVPSSVTSIGFSAFSGCSGLMSAGPIGGGYNYEFGWEENIPSNAFSGCSGLMSVNLPSNVISIGFKAFYSCYALSSISILNPACTIYDSSLTISENVTICGYTNSTAELYAKKYRRTFISLGIVESDIIPVALTALKEKTEYKTGDVLNIDDITVTVIYKDETVKVVTEFTTNISDINMFVAGKKILVITYQEGNVTLKSEIEINVEEASEIIEPKFYTVIFNTNGGTGLSETSRVIEEGKTLGLLPEVNRIGYKFTGWYKEAECKTRWDFERDVVTGDMTLYAGWEAEEESDKTTYTVTFDLQEKGTALPEYAGYTEIEKGSTIKKPDDPETDGYIFTGWYKEASCQNLWDFEIDIVETDITLYAGWIMESDYEGVLPGDTLAAGDRNGFWVAEIKNQTYTGKAIKPDMHVYDQEQRLEEGRDYTLTCKNNIKAADVSTVKASKAPQITVKGKGNYINNTFRLTFTIHKAVLNESDLAYTSVYPKGKAYTPAVVKDGILLKVKTDYTVTYEDNDTHVLMKKAPVKEGSYTMHIKGKGSCEGEFSVPYMVTAKDGSTSITKAKASVPAITYRGDMPKTALSIKGNPLSEGTDYTVIYANTDAKGTATAVFTGKGAYSGVLKKTFKIKAASIADKDVTVSTNAVYQKGGAKPEISVTVDGVKLAMGVDYTVSYKNNKRVGRTATVTIKGKGNYSGKVSKTYQVAAEEAFAYYVLTGTLISTSSFGLI